LVPLLHVDYFLQEELEFAFRSVNSNAISVRE